TSRRLRRCLRHVLVGIELDGPSGRWAERRAESFAVALDGRSVRHKRRAVNALRLVGDDVAPEANHRRETFSFERAIGMISDRFVRGLVQQPKAPQAKIDLNERSGRIATLAP